LGYCRAAATNEKPNKKNDEIEKKYAPRPEKRRPNRIRSTERARAPTIGSSDFEFTILVKLSFTFYARIRSRPVQRTRLIYRVLFRARQKRSFRLIFRPAQYARLLTLYSRAPRTAHFSYVPPTHLFVTGSCRVNETVSPCGRFCWPLRTPTYGKSPGNLFSRPCPVFEPFFVLKRTTIIRGRTPRVDIKFTIVFTEQLFRPSTRLSYSLSSVFT